MARSAYSDYVSYCMRFYSRYPKPKFRNDVDKKNWLACKSVLDTYSDSDRELLLSIYKEGDTVPDNIYKVAKARDIGQGYVWKLVSDMEQKIAKQRGLL